MQFLSMKLAAVNPRLDFNIDDLFAKEVRGRRTAEFQLIVTFFLLAQLHSICF